MKQTCSLLDIKDRILSKGSIAHLSFPYFNKPSYEILFDAALAAGSDALTFHAIVTSSETVTVLRCALESIQNESVEGSFACINALSRRLDYDPFDVLDNMIKGHSTVKNKFLDTIISKLVAHYGLSTSRLVKVYRRRRAFSRWSTILAAVAVQRAWRWFVQRALRPQSAFVQSFLKNRFYSALKN